MDKRHDAALAAIPEAEREAYVSARFWPKVRRNLARVPFVRDAVAAWYAMRDETVPLAVRAGFLAPLTYFVLPVDALPDIVLAVGFGDDAAVFGAAMLAFGRYLTEAHYAEADAALAG